MKYLSLLRWLSGRGPFGNESASVFTADRGTLGTPIAFGIAGVVEIVAVHVLVPWPWLQWTLLVASVWGLLSFAALLAHHRMHPHTVTRALLTLRTSGQIVADIDLDSVASARIHRRYGTVSAAIEHGRLMLPNQDGTSVDIDLRRAVDASLPALLPRWRRSGPIMSCSVQVDDPGALIAALTRDSTEQRRPARRDRSE